MKSMTHVTQQSSYCMYILGVICGWNISPSLFARVDIVPTTFETSHGMDVTNSNKQNISS